MFDVYVQGSIFSFTCIRTFVFIGVTADIHCKLNETIINLILTDFRIFDPNINARFQKVFINLILH